MRLVPPHSKERHEKPSPYGWMTPLMVTVPFVPVWDEASIRVLGFYKVPSHRQHR
jgi:hypothetical protein